MKLEICENCGDFTRIHQRTNPDGEHEVLCKRCYMRLYPPKREEGYCAKCSKYAELVGRGLCRHCYDVERYSGTLEKWELKS